ncbi:MAG: MYXO-CTERM sorting domain-containing protein [Planctomycetota bacterium]
MKYVFLALLAVFAGGLLAQNAPVVIVTSLGAQVPNAGGISVAANATFNSMGLAYDVSDPQNDGVGVTAVVSNLAAAVNWTDADFNKAAQITPYTHNVMSALGEFGPANTVHVVTLTFTDGTNDTVFSFTISVGATGPAPAGLPGDDGGACTATTGAHTALSLSGMLLVALVYRRRRRLT